MVNVIDVTWRHIGTSDGVKTGLKNMNKIVGIKSGPSKTA
jgi:hypothetical protein